MTRTNMNCTMEELINKVTSIVTPINIDRLSCTCDITLGDSVSFQDTSREEIEQMYQSLFSLCGGLRYKYDSTLCDATIEIVSTFVECTDGEVFIMSSSLL